MSLSRTQRLITRLVPASWAASMEEDSRAWMVRCNACGAEQSLWEMGGIRWKAKGNPRTWTWGRCPACGKRGPHTIHHRDPG